MEDMRIERAILGAEHNPTPLDEATARSKLKNLTNSQSNSVKSAIKILEGKKIGVSVEIKALFEEFALSEVDQIVDNYIVANQNAK